MQLRLIDVNLQEESAQKSGSTRERRWSLI